LRAQRLARLKELFNTEHRQLCLSALAVTRDRESAEDAVHDALVAVAEVDRELQDLRPYLYRVVRNKALHSLKATARHAGDRVDADFIQAATDTPEAQLLVDQVKRHIESVDSRYRQILLMKLFFDFTFEEIASITENSPNTVATWYRRGLIQLKDTIHESAEFKQFEGIRRSTG
jgi:RNA polymerase sigma factor (sigma-70 family)